MGEPLHQSPARGLTATMRSRKLQALDFVKRYFAQYSHSPSLSEVAAELGVSKKRAHALVQQLSEERQIEVIAGKTRGIRLVDRNEEISEADALLRLRQAGWYVKAPGEGPFTEKGLNGLPELDHE